MEASLSPTAQLLQVNQYLFRKAVTGLSADQLFQAPGDANPIIWLAGHLTNSRHGMLQVTGLELERPWQELFGRHSQMDPAESYPQFDEIQEAWDQSSERLAVRLEEMSAAQLGETVPVELPIQDKSRLAVLNFLAWHEAYHIGQMAYVRKWLGLGGLIDG